MDGLSHDSQKRSDLRHFVCFVQRGRFWLPLVVSWADLGFLARQFELSGGNIRNVALAAAFLAAEDSGEIRMEHLVLNVARELRKMGKLPAKTDFLEYYELIREREGNKD